ncbi:MAG TPA: hypothetical protein VK900_18070, partial [Anaerolineales bacterium]|nr:hypothetical protein [Anaerolineales bacterium]
AWYILQAKSILEGTTEEFMEKSAFTNGESTTHLGPLAYPWGYPLILAPVYAFKGISPLALKLPALVFYVGFLIAFYFLLRDRLSQTESLLLVAVFAFNPLLLQFLDQILSDIPFLFFSTLSLFLMTRLDDRGVFHYVLIGAAIFFTTFLRVTGILLLGSLLIVDFFRLVRARSDRIEVTRIIQRSLITSVVFAVLWLISVWVFPSGGESYLSQYAGLIETATAMAPAYFQVFGDFFGRSIAWRILYYALLIFFMLGAWERRRQEPIFLLFFILWMIVHITYPYWQGPRYIFPLLPIFIYFAFQGMKAVIRRVPEAYQRTSQGLVYGFWLLLAGIFLFTSGTNAYVNLQSDRQINGPFDPYSREVYSYIKEKTPPDSVVVFFKPRVMVMMTGHPTLMSTECERLLKGDYIVLSRKVEENQQIAPGHIGACNLPLNEVLRNNRFVVYEIEK